MKLLPSLFLASACIATNAKQFAVIRQKGAKKAFPSTEAVFAVPRGGDLGPLDTDTAAKLAVGFMLANGIPGFLATEGMMKAWGQTKVAPRTKLVYQSMNLNCTF